MEKYLQTSSALLGSIKNAVLGNPVTREYQLGRHVGSFGPGLLWKVFEGKKKTTGQEVSVFVFEKKYLDRFDKREKDLIIDVMKKGPTQLTRLRHPRLLTVQHPLEDSRESLAFATEPVFASLSNVLGKHDNLPSPLPEELRGYELYDVEKVYGLLQIAEGLAFLHNDAKLIEGNLTPDNIIITKGGQWKLAGLNFSVAAEPPPPPFEWDARIPPLAKPDLNYLAPENILCQGREVASDMYSFGCLVNAVYNKMKTPFDAGNSVTSYKRCIEQFSRLGSDYMKDTPFAVKDHVQCLMNIAPGARPDANQTIKLDFFDDVAAMTLKYLDTLVQRDEMTKSQFFKNLHRILTKLPKRVLHQRVLPHLFLEFPNHNMIPFVLPNVLMIAEDCTNEEYTRLLFPELKKIFTIHEPVQILLIFLQKMELLLKKTPQDDIRNYVLPMVFKALESSSVQVQELVVSIIPNFAHMIDYSSLKHSIVPRVKTLIIKARSLPVRVNALVCVGKIIEYLDKFLMVDEVFPVLTQVPSKDPAVLMAILGIYKQTLKHKKINLEKDYLATKAIPFLLPLAVDPGLNVSQFNNFMSVIREMLDRVEAEHRTKLEQLNQMQEQQKSAIEYGKAIEESKDLSEMMKKVDKLVLGSPEKMGSSNGDSEFSRLFGVPDNERSQQKKVQAKTDLLSSEPITERTMTSKTVSSSSVNPTGSNSRTVNQAYSGTSYTNTYSGTSNTNTYTNTSNSVLTSKLHSSTLNSLQSSGVAKESAHQPLLQSNYQRETISHKPQTGTTGFGTTKTIGQMTSSNGGIGTNISSSGNRPYGNLQQPVIASSITNKQQASSSSLDSLLGPSFSQSKSNQMTLNQKMQQQQQQQQQQQPNYYSGGMSMGNSSMIGSYGNGPRQLGPMNQFQSQRMPYGMLQGQQSSSTMINSQQFSMLTPQPTQQSVRLAQNPSSNGNSANFNDLKDLLM